MPDASARETEPFTDTIDASRFKARTTAEYLREMADDPDTTEVAASWLISGADAIRELLGETEFLHRNNASCVCGEPIRIAGRVVKASWRGIVCADCEALMFERTEAARRATPLPAPEATSDA